MIPEVLRPLFWDANLDSFNPLAYPAYTIARILEFGDRDAITWLKGKFSEAQIVEVPRTESRLLYFFAHSKTNLELSTPPPGATSARST